VSDDTKKPQDQSEQAHSPELKSRRELLATIAAPTTVVTTGVVLPSKWMKPVVESVMLPAHAQTTSNTLVAGAGQSVASNESELSGEALVEALRNKMFSPANALAVGCVEVLGRCITFKFSGGPSSFVTGSILGWPDATGFLQDFSLPPFFQIGPVTLTGEFNSSLTAGSGTITTCGISWETGVSCEGTVSSTATETGTYTTTTLE